MAVATFLLVVFVSFISDVMSGSKVLVNTTAGEVRGFEQELNGTQFRIFAGIPYAEAPTGALRFSAPLPKTPWEGRVFNATSYSPSCPQDLAPIDGLSPDLVRIPTEAIVISEDCLTLNVYAPSGNFSRGSSWAVMVWLHGGSYRNGFGSFYDAAPLAVKGNVVVVTMNYRLGPFGFLYTGDENAPGNFGLMDQQLALQWVQDNIREFGGDPDRVTLFGQADTHGSASLHMFAKASRPLFHRVVAHSGVFQASDLQESGSAISNTKLFAESANCPNKYSDTLVECLRGKQVNDIITTIIPYFSKQKKSSYLWRPVFTRDFFLTEPGDSMTYDLLSVFNSGDGSIALDLIKDLFSDSTLNLTQGVTEEQFDQWIDVYIDSPDLIDTAVEYQYVDNNSPDLNFARAKALVDIQQNRDFFRYGAEPLSDLQSLLSSSYVMIFDHRSSAERRFPRLGLVPHGAELPYVFGLPFDESRGLRTKFTDEERALSYRMIRYWSNFAKTGDPNTNGGEDDSTNTNLIWPEYGDSEKFLLMQLQDEQVGESYESDDVYFWSEYLEELEAAAAEVCPAQPTNEPPCEEPVIGEGLGLTLTRQQAETLIEAFIFTVIVLVCICIILVGAACGYKYRRSTLSQTYKIDTEQGALIKTNGSGKVNRGFNHDEGLAGTSGSSSPDGTHTDDEANSLPQKHTPSDEVPPYVKHIQTHVTFTQVHNEASVGEPLIDTKEVDDDDIFPPPPDDPDDEADEFSDVPPPDGLEELNLSDEFHIPDEITSPSPDASAGTSDSDTQPGDNESLASYPEVQPAEGSSLASDSAPEPVGDASPEADHAIPDDFHSMNRIQSAHLYDRLTRAIPQ